MKGPKLVVLLVVAALAVGVQNYLFFSSLPETPRVLGDEEEEELWGASDEERLSTDETDPRSLAAWFSAQPGVARSPFLTGAEARLLEGAPTTTPSGLPRLSGTLWSRGRRVAWIDGKARSEGDWIGELLLSRIEPTRVVLTRGDERIPLSVTVARAPKATEATDHAN